MKRVIIRAPRMFNGDSQVTEGGAVLIFSGNQIEYAGSEALAPAVTGEEYVFEDGCILPGLIDAHVHLTMDGSADPVSKTLQDSIPTASFRAQNSAAQLIRGGVTTVRDCGCQGYIAVHLAKAVEDGLVEFAPNIVACGPALCITGGHGAFVGMEADGADEMRKAVRTVIKNGAAAVKLITTGGVLTKGTAAAATQMTFQELQTAVEEAHKAGARTTTHAHAADGIKLALKAGVDSIDHSSYIDEEIIRLYHETGASYVPTLLSSVRQMEHLDEIPAYIAEKIKVHIDREIESVNRLIAEKVPIAGATDAGTPFNVHGDLSEQLYLLSRHGMSSTEALRAGTMGSASVIGVDGLRGSLEKGKQADILIVGGNPLNDLHDLKQVRAVWRGGRKLI